VITSKAQLVVSLRGWRNDSSSHMKKQKSLKKKIRRLEARMQKGANKLAKLKRKLEAAETGAAAGTKSKPAAAATEPSAAKKPKRKLNLTPERRAQLAAAMKARWAAKRAATGTNTQNTFPSPRFSPGDASQPPQ
jgi:hypothetical protein